MKKSLAIALVLACVGVCLPAAAQMGGGRPGGIDPGSIDPGGDSNDQPAAAPLPPDPEGHAEDLRLQGHCDKAIPIFRRLAGRGGFAVAEYNLGLCLFDVARTESNAVRAAGLKREGFEYLLAAANDNFPNAQLQLASVYLDGDGVTADPVEAGKWSLLYRGNGTRLALGLPGIPGPLQDRLDSTLTDKMWVEAQSRADRWMPAASSMQADQ